MPSFQPPPYGGGAGPAYSPAPPGYPQSGPALPTPPPPNSAPNMPAPNMPASYMPAPFVGVQHQPVPPQRPALLGMATMMTVTAAMLFMAALGFLWMVAWAGNESIDYNSEGGLYYLMERFHLKLAQGLWVPLFGFSTASIALAFCLLARVQWARIAYSALGALTVAWLIFVWHDRAGYIVAPIVYIAFCVGIVWVNAVTRWLKFPGLATAAPVGPTTWSR